MDQDDMMLNIVTSSSKKQINKNPTQTQNNSFTSNPDKIVSKSDVKKMKYSNLLKKRTNISRRKQTASPKFSKIQTLFDNVPTDGLVSKKSEAGSVEKFYVKKQKEAKIQQKDQISKRYQKQDAPRRRDQSTQKKFVKRQQNRGQYSNKKRIIDKIKTNANSDFKPESRKNITVTQLMPEAQLQQNKINKNNLQNIKLEPKLKDSLQKAGVTKLTQIQQKSYESLVNGVDSVIKASTGSGKTLAYLIPLVNRLIKNQVIKKRQDGTCIIVVCPTRELCVQGQKQANRCVKRCPYIVSGCLFGGEQTNHEKSRIRKGTNILFCTPGRVLYHLQQTKSFKLDNLKAIVFQEADRTLDMGFHDTITKILKILADKISLAHIHKILVSAHFNSKVSNLLQQLQMNSPHFIGFQNVDSQMNLSKLKQSKDVEINTSSQLKQQYVLMSEEQKIPLMLAYLGVLKNCKVLIFVSTIDQVQFLDYILNNLMFRDSNGNYTTTRFENRPIYKIHGDLDQKLRSKTYLQFRQSKQAILISTQVASRGLDFPDLSHIILFDVPPTITDYGNRVGRSARFNQTGVSLLMLHYIQSDYAEKIRYYAPNLQVIEKDIIYESFEKVLKSMNIGDNSLHYIQGLVRSSVKNDSEKYMIARKAYVSMLKAYSRLPDRNTFAVKKLNLKLLARSFGLNNAQNDQKFNPKAKTSHLQASRKKRKVQDVKKLQFSQYM